MSKPTGSVKESGSSKYDVNFLARNLRVMSSVGVHAGIRNSPGIQGFILGVSVKSYVD